MKLSGAYETPKSFYVVAYEDGHGTIELVGDTFTRASHALQFINENKNEFSKMHVLRASLDLIIMEL